MLEESCRTAPNLVTQHEPEKIWDRPSNYLIDNDHTSAFLYVLSTETDEP